MTRPWLGRFQVLEDPEFTIRAAGRTGEEMMNDALKFDWWGLLWKMLIPVAFALGVAVGAGGRKEPRPEPPVITDGAPAPVRPYSSYPPLSDPCLYELVHQSPVTSIVAVSALAVVLLLWGGFAAMLYEQRMRRQGRRSDEPEDEDRPPLKK